MAAFTRVRLCRKLDAMSTVLLFILALAGGQLSLKAGPEIETQANPLPVKVPHSADAILKLAFEMNGLDETSNIPWHIRLTYAHFDEDGDNDHSGTVEEFYAGPKKYKRTITSDTLNQTDVADGSRLYRSGDQNWPGGPAMKAVDAVLRPLQSAHVKSQSVRPEKTDIKFSNVKLPCVSLRALDRRIMFPVQSVYCFNADSVMLRFTQGSYNTEARYDNLVPFHGRYVARDISVTRSGKAFLKIHVEELGEIAEVGEAFFSRPEGAAPLGGRITIPSDVYFDYLISTAEPNYPPGTPDGSTMVSFVVGKDGTVIEATADGGPEPLRKAACEAVGKYRFRPYLVLDQPVEVMAKTSLRFHSE